MVDDGCATLASRQQLRLALRELVVTDDALVAKIGQPGDLVGRRSELEPATLWM